MADFETVTSKTVRTSLWGTIEKISSMGIQFVISMVLARFLSPSDYGTIAMLMVFLAISSQFVTCGFGNALIRNNECKSIDFSTAFYFNIVVSIACYVLLFLAAPFVAKFYEMDILCPVMRVCSLTIPLGALTIVQDAILQRNLEAKKLAYITTATTLLAGVIAIVLAHRGWGVWALVAHQVMSSLLRVCFLWVRSAWYPKWEYSKKSMKYLWNFGSKMLLTGIISSTYANIYSILIGKYYDSKALGLFNRGQTTAILLPNVLEGVFVRNSLPIMAQLQNDRERMIHVYSEFVKLACYLNFPIVFLVSILAHPFVDFVLTAKWLGCVIYIQIFSINALLSPANSVNLNLLQALGRSDYTLKAEIIKKSLGFILAFLLLPLGPLYLAIGSSSFGIVAYSVNLYYAKKLSGLSYRSQLMPMLPILFSCIGMSVCVILSICFIESSLLKLIVGGIVGVGSYFVLTYYVFNLTTAKKIIKLKQPS